MVQERGLKIEWTPVPKKDKRWYINIKTAKHVFLFRIAFLINSEIENISES